MAISQSQIRVTTSSHTFISQALYSKVQLSRAIASSQEYQIEHFQETPFALDSQCEYQQDRDKLNIIDEDCITRSIESQNSSQTSTPKLENYSEVVGLDIRNLKFINNISEQLKNNNYQQNKQIELPDNQEQTSQFHHYQLKQMQQQEGYVMNPLMRFKQLLSMATNPDSQIINEVTDIARVLHSTQSFEAATALIEFIVNNQKGTRLTYMYMLDSILKNVQGNYVSHFEERITQIFNVAFGGAKNDGDRKALIKLFNVWKLFLNEAILHQISTQLKLPEYESRLLQDADRQKIADFRRQFVPSLLPDEVLENGLFRTGDDVQVEQFQLEQRQQRDMQAMRQKGGHLGNTNGLLGQQNPQITGVNGTLAAAFSQISSNTAAFQQALSLKTSTFDQKSTNSSNSFFTYNSNGVGIPTANTTGQGQGVPQSANFIQTAGITPSNAGQIPLQQVVRAVENPLNQLFYPSGQDQTQRTTTPYLNGQQQDLKRQEISHEPMVHQDQSSGNVQTLWQQLMSHTTPIQQPQQFPSGMIDERYMGINKVKNTSFQAQQNYGITTGTTGQMHGGSGPYSNQYSAPYNSGQQNLYQGQPAQYYQQSGSLQGQHGSHLYQQQHAMGHYQAGSGGASHHALHTQSPHGPFQYQNSFGSASHPPHNYGRGIPYGDRDDHPNFPANQQRFASQKPIGFLPSILKSFYSFKENQQYLIGQDLRFQPVIQHLSNRAAATALQAPSFKDLSTLREFNIFAIAEVYENIKFQCSLCGQRFIRNQTLKRHLDMHFQKNNELLRKQRGNRTMGRPQFVNGVSDFMNVAKSRRGVGGDLKDGGAGMHGGQGVNPPGKSGLGGIISTQNIEDIIPYSASDTFCFICKETFEVGYDDEEESYYFLYAKKIRIMKPTSSESQVQTVSKVVPVHTDCLKHIEMNRDIHQSSSNTTVNTSQPIQKQVTDTKLLDQRINQPKSASGVIYEHFKGPDYIQEEDTKSQNDSSKQAIGNESKEGCLKGQNLAGSIEALERQTRGFIQSKRLFLGIGEASIK